MTIIDSCGTQYHLVALYSSTPFPPVACLPEIAAQARATIVARRDGRRASISRILEFIHKALGPHFCNPVHIRASEIRTKSHRYVPPQTPYPATWYVSSYHSAVAHYPLASSTQRPPGTKPFGYAAGYHLLYPGPKQPSISTEDQPERQMGKSIQSLLTTTHFPLEQQRSHEEYPHTGFRHRVAR